MPLRNVLLVITAQEEQEFLHSMKLLLDITHKRELSNQNHVLEANTSLQLDQKHHLEVQTCMLSLCNRSLRHIHL
jgi:hypothetical protein